MKITFLGAGSTVFARNVIGDCMCTPSLRESTFTLYDIDGKRLEDSKIILEAINKNVNGSRAKIETYLGGAKPQGGSQGCRLCGQRNSGRRI